MQEENLIKLKRDTQRAGAPVNTQMHHPRGH